MYPDRAPGPGLTARSSLQGPSGGDGYVPLPTARTISPGEPVTVATPRNTMTSVRERPTSTSANSDYDTDYTEEETTTPETTIPTTTANPHPLKSGTLVCTVSVKFGINSILPEHRLCDFIFYESFYLKNSPLSWNDTGLDYFLTLCLSMHITQIGASFSIVNGKLFLDAITGALRQGIDNLIDRGFLHFGLLNLYGAYSTKHTLTQCLKILKEIAEFRTYKTYPHTFIGVQFEDSNAETLPEELETVFKPSMYIAITHVSHPDFPQCRTLPMTMLECTYGTVCYERTILQAMKRQDSEERLPVQYTPRIQL
ncbi:uncharacterized protein LOC144100015 isoform X2 [Amblyomma americanum]